MRIYDQQFELSYKGLIEANQVWRTKSSQFQVLKGDILKYFLKQTRELILNADNVLLYQKLNPSETKVVREMIKNARKYLPAD